MEVELRAFKRRLSEFLARAARGELILVTERGEPKAVLGPVPGEINLERGIAEGWIRKGKGEPIRPVRRFKAMKTIQQALLDDRGDESLGSRWSAGLPTGP